MRTILFRINRDPYYLLLVGEVVRYEDKYRLCYIRGPEGILIGLAQELGSRLPDEHM
jgi:hypothetical protein